MKSEWRQASDFLCPSFRKWKFSFFASSWLHWYHLHLGPGIHRKIMQVLKSFCSSCHFGSKITRLWKKSIATILISEIYWSSSFHPKQFKDGMETPGKMTGFRLLMPPSYRKWKVVPYSCLLRAILIHIIYTSWAWHS